MAEDIKDVSTRGALIAIAIASIVIAVVVSLTALGPEIGSRLPDRDKYQAVFLTNGQVYFGQLRGLSGRYATLTDVYIVQSQNLASPSPAASPGLVLSRIDQNNLIRPEREMVISNDQILFWENMQDDAEVVKKIQEEQDKEDE